MNLAIDGRAGGRPHQGLRNDALKDAFASRLGAMMRERILSVKDGGARLYRVAAELRTVFEAEDETSAAATLNRLMRRYRASPYLIEDVGQPHHLHFHGDGETDVEALAAEFAVSLALLMDTFGSRRFGICHARDCDRSYVDVTRNGSKLYCSDACAARMKMADYRARARKR
ncbi:CGNR zinc finger domain-containing protein [Ensifer sp.]|uniref:CGNR zinc finger domain-containing protein n=1 Tax=Ensifer sp. TaxID=1872086 RepID=UPI002E1645FD